MIITEIEKDPAIALLKAKLLGSFLLFTQTFFKIKTGRDFVISQPVGREPHQITISRQLTDVFYGKDQYVWITLPPGHGKSTIVTYWVAWCFARYPECRFLYISYTSELAAEKTYEIKEIILMPLYRTLFGVKISSDISAKDNFRTLQGGTVKAFGSQGSITGSDAGLPNMINFSGAVIMDDMHKASEVHSDTIRERVINGFSETIKTRARSPTIPFVGIGHALHDDDLRARLITGKIGEKWKDLTLKAEDTHGNILAPNLITRKKLNEIREFTPYVYWSQYQGDPRPQGGGIFKTEWFDLIDKMPKMIQTFITVDTAESKENYADYTVFSFWGLYEILYKERKTGEYGLHWIDCIQDRIEPADLEMMLMDFYQSCLNFETTPRFIAIEKKSTGVTLSSVIKKIRGIEVRDIKRTAASGNKTSRFLEAQPYVAKRLVSLPKYAKHTTFCIDHMSKITTNNAHKHDDIADTLYDAIKIALIDKTLLYTIDKKDNCVNQKLVSNFVKLNNLRKNANDANYI